MVLAYDAFASLIDYPVLTKNPSIAFDVEPETR
jgi:hypothetical protein